MTAWLIEQRTRQREQELDLARLQGELAASERIERGAQRYADRLEEKLADARRREASLARAVGYLESQRDQLLQRLGLPPVPRGEPGELVPLPERTDRRT
jgi:transcription initiation factor TFIIIB Brf1 subunit/transcription initiation factor TFIIB